MDETKFWELIDGAALRDAETLADAITKSDTSEGCEFEEFRYVASRAWETRTGKAARDFPAERGAAQPAEPTGTPWHEDEAELARRFPLLCAKFR